MIQPAAARPTRSVRCLRLLAAGLLAGLQCACSTLDYYGQAVAGQFEIWRRARPIETVLAQDALTPAQRARLMRVAEARAFASARLALPAGRSYTHYADLGREFVVWNVFAAPALSLTPIESCFPLVGCLAYRGFFDRARAERHAARLRAQGHDVYVGGVAAYSTLGWFADPVLNTMLRSDERRLVEIVFHELAHRRLYLAGDTTFNESYAMAVASTGLHAWLVEQGLDPALQIEDEAREAAFLALIAATRAELAELYASAAAADSRRAAKAAAFARLRQRYAALRAQWQGDPRYDDWMGSDLNNAKLASVATYHDRVGAFRALLAACAGDYTRFHAAVARLAEAPATARAAALDALERGAGDGPTDAAQACGAAGRLPM